MAQELANLCRFLDWDSSFFGHRIASVIPHTLTVAQAHAIDQWCAENNIDCLYFLAESQHPKTIRIAEDNHYRNIDIRHVYEIDISKSLVEMELVDGLALDVATSDDIQALLPMIDNTFVHTRFYYDPHFSNERANDLYRTWLIRSIEENFADRVLLIRKQAIPQGFITCSLDQDSKIGSIGLIGVSETARGQSLGSSLVLASFAYFKQEQMQRVQVVTQGRNIAANRLYQRCGFRTSEVYLWYHKWFTKK